MITREEVNTILSSVWCTLPGMWSYRIRSNSYLRVLDLSHPGTYGIHVAYSILNDELLYVLITLPDGSDTSDLVSDSEHFIKDVYTEDDAVKVVFYRRGLENVQSV